MNGLRVRCVGGPIAGVHIGTIGDGSFAAEIYSQTNEGSKGAQIVVSSPVMIIDRSSTANHYRQLSSNAFKSYRYRIVQRRSPGDNNVDLLLQFEEMRIKDD